jgi:hypothetical protein
MKLSTALRIGPDVYRPALPLLLAVVAILARHKRKRGGAIPGF